VIAVVAVVGSLFFRRAPEPELDPVPPAAQDDPEVSVSR